jgi:hypothetical protein
MRKPIVPVWLGWTSTPALLAGLALVWTASSLLGADVQVFLDRATWQQAAGGVLFTESFDSQPVPPRIQLSPGVNHVGLLNIEVQRFSGNLICEGSFFDTVNGTPFWRIEASTQNGSTPPVRPVVWFDQPVRAFGADFNFFFPPNSTLTLNGQTLRFADYIPGQRNGFFGVTSSVPFDHVQFDVVSPFNTLFHADNVSFAVVPEPSCAFLLLAAAGAFIARATKSRR